MNTVNCCMPCSLKGTDTRIMYRVFYNLSSSEVNYQSKSHRPVSIGWSGVHLVIYWHSWCFESSQNLRKITSDHKSRMHKHSWVMYSTKFPCVSIATFVLHSIIYLYISHWPITKLIFSIISIARVHFVIYGVEWCFESFQKCASAIWELLKHHECP